VCAIVAVITCFVMITTQI